MGNSHHKIKENSSDNKGSQSPPKEIEKRKSIPEETVDIPQKRKKLGKIYNIAGTKSIYL